MTEVPDFNRSAVQRGPVIEEVCLLMTSATQRHDMQDSEVEQFMVAPDQFFGSSYTAMQTLPRERMVELQQAALVRRFEQQRERIPMVAKLAERQGIKSIDDVEDIVPLLFEHTMYKSYPVALLARQQFDKLTTWISKLTAVDVSAVDATACDSIDAWLQLLADETDLDVFFSSGTSGTMSFSPWSVRDLSLKWRLARATMVQRFGTPPNKTQLDAPYHVLTTTLRSRRNYMGDALALGLDEYFHMSNPNGYSADMGWLAARLRLAAARGDASRVEVPPSLLARRPDLERAQAEEAQQDSDWEHLIESLQGERVVWLAFPHAVYGIAAPRVGRGERWSFAPESSVLLTGGRKGHVLPPEWRSTVERFIDAPIRSGYAMIELSMMALECDNKRYHLPPWFVPFVLDPDTSELLPRQGTQRGRAAFFDLAPSDHWGGFISGDEIEVEFDEPCACGATTYHADADVTRLGEKRGGDDKISCTATPEAHAEAMQFLVGY
jgi:hypothetical protein